MPISTCTTGRGHHPQILVAYFLVIIVIIPVVVGLWWRNSSKYIEDGVMQNTAYRFYRQIQVCPPARLPLPASPVPACPPFGTKDGV